VAALDFSAIADMQTLVPELTGVAAPADLDNLLDESAATHTSGTVTVYRPYYVAAVILRRAINTKRLRSARGAAFDNPSQTIRGLMRQQAAWDAKTLDAYADYAVPAGYEASTGAASLAF